MKNYFRHFRFVFIALAVVLLVFIGVTIYRKSGTDNMQSDTVNNERVTEERVFDYADKLTDQQERNLRDRIAEAEKNAKCDIVLVTMSDGTYGSDSKMMNYADDFYDNNRFGYEKAYGAGCVLVDNWNDGTMPYSFTWFSTSGSVEYAYSESDINYLIDDVISYDDDPYTAYTVYVDSVEDHMMRYRSGKIGSGVLTFPGVLGISAIISILYMLIGALGGKGKKTTTASTYVAGGRPDFTEIQDIFITKHVTSHKIQTSSSSGGGGHHVSSGGHSHGGGGGHH